MAAKNPSMQRKIKVSNLLNIILVITLVLIVAFGWWYLKGRSPVDNVASVINSDEIPKPEYLYTIYGPENGRLNKIWNTFVADDRIYVVDAGNQRIAIFDYSGKFISEVGRPKKGVPISRQPGVLQAPSGITVVNGEIYVTDTSTRLIHVFNSEGKFLRYFAEKKPKVPVNIFYKDGKFYVLDNGTMTVQVYDQTGKSLLVFGKQGDKPGEFYYPYSVYVDNNNEIYVADSNNNRIQIFDAKGKFKKELKGEDINGSGGYSVPRGIAFDSKGNLYTAETMSNDISIANKEGKVLSRFSYAEPETETTVDALKAPTSVFIDDNQRLYVTELANSRILVYQIK
ncbi:6-bladed beta-propeller [Thermincola potens]|uniref:NHL repeat containing protein n=1 Tax=Thermincola potens (strain JR) TaxID=635013 RepID=D5XEB4_THEPJ|nr:6-bladed beta-propeller [Thermincola potens]ADG81985.1 NHL repeat containing protein [Thermincola potens JR]